VIDITYQTKQADSFVASLFSQPGRSLADRELTRLWLKYNF